MPPAPPCPCSSGLRYRQCCSPYHRGEAEPPDAEALMRSRYSAFALREAAYLWKTLHPTHPDRSRPEAEVVKELRAFAQSHQFPGLVVMDRRAPDAQGVAQVLFFAKVFERGKDRSFVERSDFRHDGTGWRYVSGTLRLPKDLAGPPEALTLTTFPE
ncbi:YchJ family protein [Hyalangium versicolor]|uniref:YchJ family protein n=1 Tax=Hyalangium versicolor TaxID=2861190 RepID=UPI001CCE3788|nr:YchJ family metal-binding protein [Hyalangium versicolor]